MWNRSGVNKKRNFNFGLTLGVRLFTHYNRTRVLSTPPESKLGEAQLVFWYKQSIALNVVYARSLGGHSAQFVGAGLKIPFLTFAGAGGVVGGISMMLVGDFLNYSYGTPPPPEAFETSGWMLRYGGSINWGIGRTGLLLDTTMMFSNHQGNFFVAPFIGLGYIF